MDVTPHSDMLKAQGESEDSLKLPFQGQCMRQQVTWLNGKGMI
jgi:hypothetical protein